MTEPEQTEKNSGLQPQPLRSANTSNLPEIFHQLGISVLVSTYQSGHLVMLRPDKDVLNTHFRIFDKPMRIADDANRLAIGTAMEVIEFHNLPAVASRLHPPNVNGTVFLPRVSHWTGNIQIHEMAWVKSKAEGAELVFINTLFSCLCRRSNTFSFEPIWRPWFIKKISARRLLPCQWHGNSGRRHQVRNRPRRSR